ncbi:MAG: DUF1080 domain-containing protein [Spirosomataceae bacterium]
MKTRILLASLLLVVNLLAFGQKTTPWKPLFDGKTFANWDIIGSNGIVKILDDSFEIGMRANTPEHTFLKTQKKYKDFILELDCKKDTEFNSGILFRAIPTPDTASVSLYGYQIKLDPSPTRRWTGGLFDDFGKTWNWIYSLKDDERARKAEKLGEWNHFRIEMIGKHIKVWVNDTPTLNLTHSKYTKAGWIGFKMHSLGDKPDQEKYKAQFKNIQIIDKKPRKYSKQTDLPLTHIH